MDVTLGDVRDPNGVRIVMDGCEAGYHLAALIAIPYCYDSPDTYIDNGGSSDEAAQALRQFKDYLPVAPNYLPVQALKV